MIKKLIIGTLVAVLLAASGMSALSALAAPSTGTNSLSANETAGLLYMYEEEKLARDVYNSLYSVWGQVTFQNIAAAEQTHMEAIQTLLIRYGIAVPDTAPGIFKDASLQKLYDDLTAAGRLSLAEALRAGAMIEETDIADLQARLAQAGSADIQFVYNRLMNGSINHLRSFISVLERLTGAAYQPRLLGADLYSSIVSGSNGNGNGQGWRSTGTPTIPGLAGNGYRGGR